MAEFPSEVSEKLELVLYRGQLMLDTETANYSYGNLHTVMEAALAEARSWHQSGNYVVAKSKTTPGMLAFDLPYARPSQIANVPRLDAALPSL